MSIESKKNGIRGRRVATPREKGDERIVPNLRARNAD